MKNRSRKRKSRHPVVRFFKYRILHINDSPHRIALGLAVGLFTAFSPLVGLHLPIAILLAFLLKANKFTAVLSVWVCNIFTLVLIYYPCYLVGWLVCRGFGTGEALGPGQVSEMLTGLFSFGNILSVFYTSHFWIELWKLLKVIGLELAIGGFILGTAVALIAYFACLGFIEWHRKHNPHKRFAKH